MLVPLLDADAGRRDLAQVLLEERGLGLERHEGEAARHESADDGDDLRESLSGGALRDVDADEAQAVLDYRIPGDAHKGAFCRVVLVGGLGGHACESRQGLGGAPDPQHDAEKHGEHAERVVVGLSAVREELAPAVQVGELLHDPQGVRVILHQVRGDRAEHREAAGDTRDEGDGRRLVRLVGDCLLREPVDLGQGDSGVQRVRADRMCDYVVTQVEFAQLLTQELLAGDAHAGHAHDLRQELERSLFRRRLLPGGIADRFAMSGTAVRRVGHRNPPRLTTRSQRAGGPHSTGFLLPRAQD